MKKIITLLLLFISILGYSQVNQVLTDDNGKVVLTSDGTKLLTKEQDPNNFEYTPNPEWIPVAGVANNEIWILAFDGTGDMYSSFKCTVANSGTYNMDIIGGVDGTTVLSTYGATASGTQMNFQIPNGTGKYCLEGYYTYKIRIYATNNANSITEFSVEKHPSTAITYNNWKIINFGTKNITGISCLEAGTTVYSICPYLLYGNTYYCTKVSSFFAFGSSGLVKFTMPKTMNNISRLAGRNNNTVLQGSFSNCIYLEDVHTPVQMNSLVTLGGGAVSYLGNANTGAFYNCKKLNRITLPNTLPALTNLDGNYSTNSYLTEGSWANCNAITEIKGAENLPVLASMKHTFSNDYLLTNIPTFTAVSSNSILFISTGLRALTSFNQPILRCSSFTLTGTNNADRSNINYIQIDWANSQFTGDIDIRYNNLSAVELDRIFTALPTVVVSRTIYVASNVGSATCTPTIATAKNWIVVVL